MAQPAELPNRIDQEDDFFLPDFCNVQALLRLVIVAELLVLVWELGLGGLQYFDWYHLGLSSFFVQWLVLLSAAMLCRLRRPLGQLPLVWGAGICYLLILLLTLLCSVLAQVLMSFDISPVWDVWQIIRNVLIGAVMAGIALRYLFLQQQLRQQQQAELRSRLEALQARIRPHFLFNSMNIIASLIAVDPDKAERVVEDLSELFRASLRVKRTEVLFQDELALCQKYTGIEQLRLGERLRLEWQLGAIPANVKIPSLTLQPLLENAIYHGIQPLPQGGVVKVQGVYEAGQCVITISNPIPSPQNFSMGHTQNVSNSGSPTEGNRVAVDNIRRRLQALYGDKSLLRLQAVGDSYVTTLSYPAQIAEGASSA